MSEDLTIDDIDDVEDQDNPEQREELQKEILQRCRDAGIETELRESFDNETYVAVGIPNGREK